MYGKSLLFSPRNVHFTLTTSHTPPHLRLRDRHGRDPQLAPADPARLALVLARRPLHDVKSALRGAKIIMRAYLVLQVAGPEPKAHHLGAGREPDIAPGGGIGLRGVAADAPRVQVHFVRVGLACQLDQQLKTQEV